jgi:hypothetical protein
LDEVIGDGFCLLAFAADPAAAVDATEGTGLAAKGVATLCITPRRWNIGVDDGARTAVRDIDGAAAAAFAGYENDFLLLRPDRYVAAAVPRGSPEAIVKTVDDLFGATWQKGT